MVLAIGAAKGEIAGMSVVVSATTGASQATRAINLESTVFSFMSIAMTAEALQRRYLFTESHSGPADVYLLVIVHDIVVSSWPNLENQHRIIALGCEVMYDGEGFVGEIRVFSDDVRLDFGQIVSRARKK